MNTSTSLYKRHRFPSDIIQYAVWLYHRFNMSHRDIEDLLFAAAADRYPRGCDQAVTIRRRNETTAD